MPLPKINHPIYEVYLKSLDKKVKFRPFLVKEEKLLLMAKEGEDATEIIRTIKQIISNCIIDDIDVDALPTFDIEMFFINLRIRSVGEAAEMVYTCNNVIAGEDGSPNQCGHKIEFSLDLNNVNYTQEPGHNPIIKLTDNVGMKFNYPTLNFTTDQLNDKLEDGGYKFISDYLDYVYDSEQIYKRKDMGEEELKEFLDELTMDQVQAIRNFFETSPKVMLKQDVTCGRCNHVHHLDVEGLLSFFD